MNLGGTSPLKLTAVTEAVVDAVRREVPRALRFDWLLNLAGPLEKARACLQRHDGQTKGREESDSEETALPTNGSLEDI